MARRAAWRIPININIRFHCCDRGCSGTVTNLSENGMFISTDEMCFPNDSQFKMTIPMKEETLHVSARLIRPVKTDYDYNGIGVELLNPPKEYLNFVDNLMYVL